MISNVTAWTTQHKSTYVVVVSDRGEYVGRFPATGKVELFEKESGLADVQVGNRMRVHVMDHTGFYLGGITCTRGHHVHGRRRAGPASRPTWWRPSPTCATAARPSSRRAR